MPEFNSPSEIAREVLRQLATQRFQPTPEHFAEFYYKIAGTQAEEAFPERQLKLIASTLPRDTAQQIRLAKRFDAALAGHNWQTFKSQLTELLAEQTSDAPPWASLIRDLVAQLERRQSGLNSVRKQEALEHVLSSSANDVNLLHSRLHGLVKGWIQLPNAAASELLASGPDAEADAATIGDNTSQAWRNLLAQVLEGAIGMLLIETPELSKQASVLAKIIRNPIAGEEAKFEKQLKEFSYKVEWVAQDQSYIRQALLNLLHLIVENISELIVDDKWIQGQMSVLLELFSRPLDKKVLEELGERLRDVIYKQGTLKHSLSEAQNRLRDMLAHFIDRLGELSESTGTYHSKMAAFADKVTHASSIDELSVLIGEVVKETRVVEDSARRSKEELQSLRATVDQANREIARLENELEQASAMVRHDPLTGALNRKGLEEMMAREIARMKRRKTTLCVALLDVDDFKRLNDTFGHATGDDALKHLAVVIRENLRPQDSCGRYGGEEFVVLLPDTLVEGATTTLTRLQRELTKRFFLHDNQKLLITFSAGVTQFIAGEEAQVAIDRADKAMYRAKRAGKNRVEAA
ncbi:MAG TPA: diguanylate cyclase [Rhodocyclaceae bacterium]|nr:diguanylate cyclase [Rhodocyclaceae bacterium]